MQHNWTIDQIVERAKWVILKSEALFGYVYERLPDADGYKRGITLPGSIQDPAVLDWYYKTCGDRALEVLKRERNEASPVAAPDDALPPGKGSWFAAILTQQLGAPACVIIIYPFYDAAEALRILTLVQMVFALFRR